MQRNIAIDFLRGLVILLMTIDHSRDMFSSISIGDHLGVDLPISHYLARWITHLCAPTFVFLAGLSIVLRQQHYQLSRTVLQTLLFKRGFFLIILSSTLISLFWTIILGDKVFTLYNAELMAIGAGMMFLALMLFLPLPMILGISLLLVAGHHLLSGWDNSTSIVWSILHVKRHYTLVDGVVNIISFFPLLPWLGILGMGYAAGFYGWRSDSTPATRKLVFLTCAIVSLSLFIWLRYTNLFADTVTFTMYPDDLAKTLMSFFDVSKYPPSLLYSLITLSFIWFFLAYSDAELFSKPNLFVRIVTRYGQAALFYYMLHLGMIALYAHIIALFNHGTLFTSSHIIISLSMALIVTISSYPIVNGFIRFKKQYKDRFPLLSYI